MRMSKFMRISADADPDAELRYTSNRNVGSVSNRRKVNLDIDTNSGNINILQNDIQELKSEILKKNDMINSMKRELSFINKRLEDEEKIDEISEGIVENALAEEKEKALIQ